MKKRKRLILYMIIILTLTLTGCSQNSNDKKDVLSKLDNEVDYLDTQILGMLNNINNISFQKYRVTSEEISNKESTASGGKSSGGTQPETQTDSGNSSGGEQSQGQSSESSGSGSSGSNESKQNSSASQESSSVSSGPNEENAVSNYKMTTNNILSRQETINWSDLKIDIESMYDTWAIILLDLYKADADNTLTQNFSTDMDACLAAIKAEDKQKTLDSLAKLYSYVPKFSELNPENSNITNILKTKASVVNAYVLASQENKWQEISNELTNAEQNYMPIVNDIDASQNEEFNVNKAYILLKELQKSLSTQDKDIFYINYKNLIQELNVMQQ